MLGPKWADIETFTSLVVPLRPTAVLAIILLMAMLPWTTAQTPPPEEGVEYKLLMRCPGEISAITGCPVVAPDGQDAMGDPVMIVDPDNTRNMIIASLHGDADSSRGPDAKARTGDIFTTFTSTNEGANWVDRPWTPPQGVSGGFGITPALTADPYGRAFIGSLYALPQGSEGHFEYVIGAQKFSDIRDISSNQNGAYRVEYIRSIYPGNQIQDVWFAFNPVTDNMTMVWSEKLTQYSSGFQAPFMSDNIEDVLTQPKPDLPEGLLPKQVSESAQQGTGTPKSTIGVIWTSGDFDDDYHAQKVEHAIAPCEEATNPVISYGWLYIGCKFAEGEGEFPYKPGAKPGSLHLFRMDPDGGTPQYMGEAPISGGSPKLGVRSDGRIALMTVEAAFDGLRLDAAYGTDNDGKIVWTKSRSFGTELDGVHPLLKLVDANIQDMIYREYSGVLHLILRRNVEPADDVAGQAGGNAFPKIQKAIVALDEKYGVLAEMDLDVGNPVNRSKDPYLARFSDAAYNDIKDDFLELPPWYFEFEGRPLGDHYMREFIAVGDYGVVIFAEIIELTELRGPPQIPLPQPPPPPVPAPAAATVSTTASAAALTATALLSGTVATAKRKHISGVKPGKKKKKDS